MNDRSPDEVVWDLLVGALLTRALGIVADLRIAGALANGPRPVDDLAREAGVDSEKLARILRALASYGVFAESDPGIYSNTTASEALADRWSPLAHLFAGEWHRAAGALDVTSTETAFERTFGTDYWTWLSSREDERAIFDAAMGAGGRQAERRARLARLTWRGDEMVVDVGGGNGSLLREILRDRPGLRGIVFDLPDTARDESTFGERMTFVAGSFFESVPQGDVYILATILHDWDDAAAASILRTIRASASDHARLIVLDGVVPSGNDRSKAKTLDLLMLAVFDGRERGEAQWRSLLKESGFEPTRIDPDGLIEARCR